MESNSIHLLSDNIYDLIHYKKIEKMRGILKNKDHPNIVLYGNYKCGKTIFIQKLFTYLYGDNQIIHDDSKLRVYGNKTYYYIYCNHIYDKEYFKGYINDIVKSYDYYNDTMKYIILDNYNLINDYIQRFLKVIIERSNATTKFIIITNKLNYTDPAIRSRCLLFRLNEPSIYDKIIYLQRLFRINDIYYNQYLLEKDCRKYNLQELIHKYSASENYMNIYEKITSKITDFLFFDTFDILKIKKISSEIKELNTNFEKIVEQVINIFFKIYSSNTNQLYLLIKEITKNNHILQTSFRDIIYIESIIINLYSIINS